MDAQANCYVAGALAAMLRMSRLGGLAPLKFLKKGSGWRVSFSPAWSYYGYFIVTIIIVTTMGALISEFQLQQEQLVQIHTKIDSSFIVSIVSAVYMVLIAATSVFGAPAQMRAMIACMNHVEKINFELNIRHSPMHCEQKNTHIFFIWTTVTVLLSVVDYVLMICDSRIDQIQKWISAMYLFYYCCFWILQLREINFIMITLHVMYCFRGVNNSLKNLLHDLADDHAFPLMTLFSNNFSKVTKKKSFKNGTNKIADSGKRCSDMKKTTHHQETVRRLALAYTNTCDVVREVDSNHGLIVLMMLGSFLLLLVCTPYYLITFLFKNKETLEVFCTWHLMFIGVQLLWCFYHTANFLMLIEPCHMTYVEMETTSELVSHLIRCTTSFHDPLMMELEMFSKHIFLNQTSYTAMHVTTISRSLVVTILSSITTYLVIMIEL